MMKRFIAKAALIGAQSSTWTVIVGYLVFRSPLVVVPGALSIIILINLKCGICKTSFQDERIYSKAKLMKFYDTKIIDECPVCGSAMFG